MCCVRFINKIYYRQFNKIFKAEFESLKAIENTKTVRIPHPIVTGSIGNKKHYLVLEHLDMTSFQNKTSAELGRQLADMHLHNFKGESPTVNKYGFDIDTTMGNLRQNNTWNKDWIV